MRDAIKYLEQVSILGGVSQANVAQFLGVVSDAMLQQAMELLLGTDPNARMNFLDDLVTKGVDLTNLVKEILLRLDEHFLENPAVYAQLADLFREISADAKRYPHPVLLWKAKTRHRFEQQGTSGTNVERGKLKVESDK